MLAKSSYLLLVGAGDAAVLATERPQLPTVLHGLAAPHAWVERAGADGAAVQLASALLWIAAAWFGLAVVVAAGARLPGAAGRTARRACTAIVGSTLARVLIGVAGAGVVLSPAASADPAPSVPVLSVSAAVPTIAAPAIPHLRVAGLPTPVGPTSLSNRQPSGSFVPEAPPASASTSVAPITVAPAMPMHTGPRSTPSAPAAAPPPTAASAPPPPTAASAAAPPTATASTAPTGVHVVRPGDTLWDVTARALGPHASPREVATAWPLLYAHNRSAIGADPDLIHPGQRLRLPPEWTSTAPPPPSDTNEVPR